MASFGENVKKPKFSTLSPPIKIIFQNSGTVTFFALLTPNFMQTFRKNNERLPRHFKTDGRTMDGQTDGRTNKSDYYGPYRVNPGSKVNILMDYDDLLVFDLA